MAKAEVVVDTNVPLVANGKAEQADKECVVASVQALKRIESECRVILDDKREIVGEYLKNLSPSGEPGLGDAFFMRLWNNQANPLYCIIVPITPHDVRIFAEFPEDPRLSQFDIDDRKFVAAALSSGTSPELLNAVDRDWWQHRQPLQEHGVNVVFLCPEFMQRKQE